LSRPRRSSELRELFLHAALEGRVPLRELGGLRFEPPRLRLDLVEQADVLDRDRCLISEGLEQRLLTLRDRPGLCPADHDRTEWLAIAQHGHTQHPPPVQSCRKPRVVVRIGERVLQPDHGSAEQHSPGHLGAIGAHWVLRPHQLLIARANVVPGDEVQELAVEPKHVCEQTAAEGHRVAHDRVEHGLGVGPRVRDPAQDLARGAQLGPGRRELAIAHRHSSSRPANLIAGGGHGAQPDPDDDPPKYSGSTSPA
jgi:hypothetical protein